MHNRLFTILAFILTSQTHGLAQQSSYTADLSNPDILHPVNRHVDFIQNNGKSSIHMDARPGDGVAWIKNVSFSKGTVDVDIKGKNLPQQSFVGIAIHGIDDSTFDVVYFRPFNFGSTDTIRRGHSVQYVSLPRYDWSFLREKFPGKYESKLNTPVDPESWFHVKIVIAREISVYVNGDHQSSLVVLPLNDRNNGQIGFWVGNNSEGEFANLSIQNQ